jgi:uncharacterized protein YndB with AHSA1/START domain
LAVVQDRSREGSLVAKERDVRTYSVEIDRPAPDVFAYIVDLTRHGEWSPAELRIEPLAPGRPAAVGGKFRSFGTTGGKPFENQVEITELEPDKRFGFSAQTQKLGNVRHTFVLTPIAGGVRVDRIIDMPKSQGITALLVAVLVPPRQKKTLQLLKARLEGANP